MHNFRYFLLAAALSVSPLALAEEEASGFTVAPGLGYTWFDDVRNVQDDNHYNIGLGYRFDSPFALELNYQSIGAKTNAGVSTDVDFLHLDGLYSFPTESQFKPFVSLGLGKSTASTAGVDVRDTAASVGAGVKYLFSPNSALRADLRAVTSNAIDIGLTVSYQYTFGAAKPAPMPVAPVNNDLDNDGVMNANDKCPNTDAGVRVDASGCPNDNDNDGVVNSKDKCSNTPRGVTVDMNGCGPDQDHDGVPDHRDACPETVPPALVDEKGCYVILKENVRITLNVEFDFDSANARPAHTAEVKKVADFMAKYPLTRVTFEGHTDSRGAADYNQRLSEKRAATIAGLLATQFNIATNRISSKGLGETKPEATNETSEGRQRNRRVVAEVVAIEETKKRLN